MSGSQATRLDRLVLLLETGTTQATRKAAAEQIGDLALQSGAASGQNALIYRVGSLLRHKQWDTRVAAAQAIEAICRCIPPWIPDDGADIDATVVVKKENEEPVFSALKSFDVETVIAKGQLLVSSVGSEFDFEDLDPHERLAQQKKALRESLGLGPVKDVGKTPDVSNRDDSDIYNVNDTVQDEDFLAVMQPAATADSKLPQKRKAADFMADMEVAKVTTPAEDKDLSHLSARERNQLRRKQRNKQREKSANIPPPPQAAAKAAVGVHVTDQPQDDKGRIVVESVKQLEVPEAGEGEWPLEPFCDDMCHDIFDTQWEIRHGAAMALRDILKHHASCAGKVGGSTKEQQSLDNVSWLEECAVRLLCVLALDRFGDYVSDQVVAPVRETCAQALGVVVRRLPEYCLAPIISSLSKLMKHDLWEVRLGGMLGFKYVIAVRQEAVVQMLDEVIPVVRAGIEDHEDDVRSVSAEALTPLVSTIVGDPRISKVYGRGLLTLLWDTLLNLDDLTASTSSVMNLIAEFFSRMLSFESLDDGADFAAYIRRLWPFFRHNIHSVRRAVLRIFSNALKFCQTGQSWLPLVLADALHLVFVNLMLEQRAEVHEASMELWDQMLRAANPSDVVSGTSGQVGKWFTAVASPPGSKLDASIVKGIWRHGQVTAPKGALSKGKAGGATAGSDPVLTNVDDYSISIHTRVSGVHALGILAYTCTSVIPESLPVFVSHIEQLLSSGFGTQIQVGAMVLAEWAAAFARDVSPDHSGLTIQDSLQSLINYHLATIDQPEMQYSESTNLTAKWKGELSELLGLYHTAGVKEAATFGDVGNMTPLNAMQLAVTKTVEWEVKRLSGSVDERDTIKRRVVTTIGQLQEVQRNLHMSVLAAVASVLVETRNIPSKVAPLIRAIMDSIQRESKELLQRRAANAIVGLMRACVNRKANPAVKICNNLCVYLCEDQSFTPRANSLQCPVESITMDMITWEPPSDTALLTGDDEMLRMGRLKKRGAAMALMHAVETYGANVFSDPGAMLALWGRIVGAIQSTSDYRACWLNPEGGEAEDARAQDLIDMLQVLHIILPSIHEDAQNQPLDLLPFIVTGTTSAYAAVRQTSCRLLAEACRVIGVRAMEVVIKTVIPLLGDTQNIFSRLGACEALHRIVHCMGMKVLPFAVFLVVPILGRMSDAHVAVRQTITQCFGTLLKLLPLEAGIPDPEGMSKELIKEKAKERRFLEQLLDTSKIDNYSIPVKIEATLRKYQQDGVNWMAFLLKYKLHGILCDDMGLGKTLQTICIIASDHHDRKTEFAKTQNPSSTPLPSLVVCPPTLIGHWTHEIANFCHNRLSYVQYCGIPSERTTLRPKIKDDVVVITSYDTVRSDIDFLSTKTWNYCVLDEGHVIKNAKSGISKGVKKIQSNHRLILSGTPIQNNVLELWSLFDFLMPGFLGSEQYFNQAYSKPILASRGGKCTAQMAEAGALALEALHRQVLPFMLRRTKTEVLSDLPPKIIQDHHCELSDVQRQIYNDYVLRQQQAGLQDSIKGAGGDSKAGGEAQHIFQALQYLRKLTNHPKLVLDKSHNLYKKITSELSSSGRSLQDISMAPKLLAVRQLLWDCGIGVEDVDGQDNGGVDGQGQGIRHRVLIFAQMKVMLDIIEEDLFRRAMPSVTFLRMDGGTPANKRFEIQQVFNGDPTIDVLMLTTHVGGLGLNLTGADTVIFVEHDWNPMRDLQAMDRAHRIGQKNVVNVYRLITRDTLEEKIMGLQRFKLNIANSVVNEDNASLKNMDTTQLLDLFLPVEEDSKQKSSAEGTTQKGDMPKKGKLAEVMQSLEELWDEEQYNEEFNVRGFLASLPGQS